MSTADMVDKMDNLRQYVAWLRDDDDGGIWHDPELDRLVEEYGEAARRDVRQRIDAWLETIDGVFCSDYHSMGELLDMIWVV